MPVTDFLSCACLQLLRGMEESYRQRLEAEVEAMDRKQGPAAAGGEERPGSQTQWGWHSQCGMQH